MRTTCTYAEQKCERLCLRVHFPWAELKDRRRFSTYAKGLFLSTTVPKSVFVGASPWLRSSIHLTGDENWDVFSIQDCVLILAGASSIHLAAAWHGGPGWLQQRASGSEQLSHNPTPTVGTSSHRTGNSKPLLPPVQWIPQANSSSGRSCSLWAKCMLPQNYIALCDELDISEWPFTVGSPTAHLSNEHPEVPHLWGGCITWQSAHKHSKIGLLCMEFVYKSRGFNNAICFPLLLSQVMLISDI